ncbi:MAG: hypothetical protein IPM54_28905 [Polyangiaceae bacterium]|nr:hypothetical protein [Polyangiaceae bacterium]
MKRPFHSFVLLFATLLPVSAFAQQPDAQAKAEAQKLYEDGAKDMEVDAYARACPKFEAAFKILPDHIRTGLTLAECWDKFGRPATALGVLERVAPLAKARGDNDKMAEIDGLIADLNKRVPKLTIRVPDALSKLPGFAITRNGTPLPAASWGTEVPLDPGEYEVEASAVDKPSWKTMVKLETGNAKTVEITPGWEIPKTDAPPPPPPPSTGLRTAGFVGLGLGALGLGAWGVLGGLAISRNSSANGHCTPDNICDDIGFNDRREAITLGHGATVGLIAGGIFAAAGVTLVVLSPSSKSKSTSLWVNPSGMGVRMTW